MYGRYHAKFIKEYAITLKTAKIEYNDMVLKKELTSSQF